MKMKRWVIAGGANGLHGLSMEELIKPEPGPGQIRLRVMAAALNYRDQLFLENPAYRRSGPLIPLSDGAGLIDAVGPGVSEWRVGDRVTTVYLRDYESWPPHSSVGSGLGAGDEDGVLSEFVVLPVERVIRAPEGLSLIEAATLPCAALTAWSALNHGSACTRGRKVLALGTGGVALFTALFANAIGAEVYSTTSHREKVEKLINLCAAQVVDRNASVDWGAKVFQASGGVDKVINTAGQGSLGQCFEALKPGGDIALVGAMDSLGEINLIPMMQKGLSVYGVSVGSKDEFREMNAMIEAHRIKPPIGRLFDFGDALSAYRWQIAPECFGKTVIKVTNE